MRLDPRGLPGLVAAFLLASLWSADLTAQDFAVVEGKEPIPREPYKTWSIFLVTNQDWLVSENAERLRELYADVDDRVR